MMKRQDNEDDEAFEESFISTINIYKALVVLSIARAVFPQRYFKIVLQSCSLWSTIYSTIIVFMYKYIS
jgi:hypothetical protein